MRIAKIDVRKNTDQPGLSWSEKRREQNKRTIIYVHPTNFNVMEDFMLRMGLKNETCRDRGRLYRRFVPAALEALGLESDRKVSWRQTAGCGCGCSPGFVVADCRGKTVFMDVEFDAANSTNPPSIEEPGLPLRTDNVVQFPGRA